MFHGGHGGGGGGFHMHGAADADFDDDTLGKVYDNKVVMRIIPYLIRVKKFLSLGIIGVILNTVAQLAGPYLVAMGTDYILEGDLSGLNIVVFAYIGAQMLLFAGHYLETLYMAYTGESMLLMFRTEMFDHLHRLSMSFFDHNKVGKLMSRVQNDVNQLQQLLGAGIVELLASVLTLVGIIVIMLTMNARLALLTLTVIPVLAILVFIWQKYARRAFIRARQAISIVNDQLQETISGVRVIQGFSREDVNFDLFDNVNKANLDANVHAVRLQSLMMPAVEILTNASFAIVLIFGGFQVLGGDLKAGVLIAFLLYIQRFFGPVVMLTMLYTELQRSMASGARIFELLDVKPVIVDKPDAIEMPRIKGEVKFDDVTFAYEPGLDVLHNIDLTVKPGETVAIIGRTGAGKSSLMNLMGRYYEVDRGKITLDGYDINSVTTESLRRQIGIVPQEPYLFSGTIEENIRYGNLEATYEEVVEAAKAVGAHEFIMHMEKGYDTSVGERGSSLSAGQRQFICLARAILANPPIIVLDEATSNVDTNAERLMQKSLRSLSEGRTSLIIAHRLSTVTNADRIVALENGRIVEMGSHQELLEKKGLYYEMFGALSTSHNE